MRYIALLRGINVQGRNKVPMEKLREEIKALGFDDVKTLLASGNVVFSTRKRSIEVIRGMLEKMMKTSFGLELYVHVIRMEDLIDILEHAPSWWGTEDKRIYSNLIFIIPPATKDDVLPLLGKPTEEYERFSTYKNAIFWAFEDENSQKCAWWKTTARSKVSRMLTIRTAGTARRIAALK